MSKRTTREVFDLYTTYLATVFEKGGVPVTNEEGEVTLLPIDDRFLAVVGRFLKDFPPDESLVTNASAQEVLERYKIGSLPFSGPTVTKKPSRAAAAQ